MTQTNNRFLDEIAKLMTDAAGAADGLKREVDTLMRAQGERFLRDMDVVQREEFEAVKAMAEKARAEAPPKKKHVTRKRSPDDHYQQNQAWSRDRDRGPFGFFFAPEEV